jgi:hypothetical protein
MAYVSCYNLTSVWQSIKDRMEGHTVQYTFDKDDFSLDLEMPDTGQIVTTDVSHLRGKTRIADSGEVKMLKVDTIRRQLKFDFL